MPIKKPKVKLSEIEFAKIEPGLRVRWARTSGLGYISAVKQQIIVVGDVGSIEVCWDNGLIKTYPYAQLDCIEVAE